MPSEADIAVASNLSKWFDAFLKTDAGSEWQREWQSLANEREENIRDWEAKYQASYPRTFDDLERLIARVFVSEPAWVRDGNWHPKQLWPIIEGHLLGLQDRKKLAFSVDLAALSSIGHRYSLDPYPDLPRGKVGLDPEKASPFASPAESARRVKRELELLVESAGHVRNSVTAFVALEGDATTFWRCENSRPHGANAQGFAKSARDAVRLWEVMCRHHYAWMADVDYVTIAGLSSERMNLFVRGFVCASKELLNWFAGHFDTEGYLPNPLPVLPGDVWQRFLQSLDSVEKNLSTLGLTEKTIADPPDQGSLPPANGANGANTSMLFPGGLPDDEMVVKLAVRIDAEHGSGKSKNQIARELTGESLGDEGKAQSLLSRLRKLVREGIVSQPNARLGGPEVRQIADELNQPATITDQADANTATANQTKAQTASSIEQTKSGRTPQGIEADTKRGVLIVDGQEFEVEPHQAKVIEALLKAGGDYLSYPKFSELDGCAGKNWAREFKKLRHQIPGLNGYLRIERGKGTRLVLPH